MGTYRDRIRWIPGYYVESVLNGKPGFQELWAPILTVALLSANLIHIWRLFVEL